MNPWVHILLAVSRGNKEGLHCASPLSRLLKHDCGADLTASARVAEACMLGF